MEKLQRSQAFLRKRKMMLVLPLLVIPFLTMTFWALGGGGNKQIVTTAKQAGLNLNLPDAGTKEDNMADKLSFYEKAEKDSVKKEEWMRTDPYYRQKIDTTSPVARDLELLAQTSATKYNQPLNTSPYEVSGNNPEQKLMKKLSQLQIELNKKPDTESQLANETVTKEDDFNEQINRLENMMQGNNNTSSEDPEIKQLGSTLDKILDIQHPQRIKDRLKEKSLQQKEVVFAVCKLPGETNISLLDTTGRKQLSGVGFYTTETINRLSEYDNAIEAKIPENQVLVNGAVIKLQLKTDVYINGVLIAKNNLVAGIASLNDERLNIEINTFRYNNALFPVKLEVYDMDGLPGVYIPGAITRDVAKQSGDDTLQLMELTSVDPTFKAQAAAAGINTVKSLLNKKVKEVKVMV